MKKVIVFAVALVSFAQGAVAGQDFVETTGQKDPWKNGVVAGTAVICEKREAKSLPVESGSERAAPKSASSSLRGI